MPPSTPRKLQETLQRASGGDEAAWSEIVEAYTPRVFGLIRAQCGSVDLAEEVTQATFCAVAQNIGRYVEAGRFESWLFRIAMNRLRDEMRRRRRQAGPVDPETLAALGGEAPAPAAGGEAALEDIQALQAALARLNEADRQVIHLRHFAGLTFEGVAGVLGEPLGTILARHHRALRKLRRLISGEEGAGQ
jgi:RNA polymerase sigma-70 factor (ECF subfamily)